MVAGDFVCFVFACFVTNSSLLKLTILVEYANNMRIINTPRRTLFNSDVSSAQTLLIFKGSLVSQFKYEILFYMSFPFMAFTKFHVK